MKISQAPVGATVTTMYCGCVLRIEPHKRTISFRREGVAVLVVSNDRCRMNGMHNQVYAPGKITHVADGSAWGDVIYDPLAAALEGRFEDQAV